MAQRLASELGIGVGISSGTNLLASVVAADRIGDGAVVATVFSDDNKKYLSTDLLRDEPARPDHLSGRIELLGFQPVKRSCAACCDGESCERLDPFREASDLAEVRPLQSRVE